ncbi:MAG: iron-sulfur cluster assembly accessory protein [Acidobacteria bacterium]|nr:iron-sulfur cluster assembly accessory protein [Acidobacteriota bacterium]
MIHVTEKAQAELERILREEAGHATAIRIGVRGGGCSGFSYVMDLVTAPNDDDQLFNADRTPIYIDPKSLQLIQGLQIDFASDLLNRGFKFSNPNASQSCGCGTSFAV